jgi:transcriptional regulator with XRE-family HTH domain
LVSIASELLFVKQKVHLIYNFVMAMNEFAKWLDRMLHDMRMEQKELARRLGTNESQVSRWRNGTNMPRRATIQRISKALEVPTPYFKQEDEQALEVNEAKKVYQVDNTDHNVNPIDQKLIDLRRTLQVASAIPKNDRSKLDAVQQSVELMRSLLRDLEEIVRAEKLNPRSDS